jgi:Zn-dependent M28 family amino/carboxypeptidase
LQAWACNVAAVLRGSDPQLAAEAIVYSAHMDHVGSRIDGEVFNGADDNASGSAGLLAIASAFANGKQKPRRSVIFLSVSGEELGLWGSAYYADHPTWPADRIIANINTDMIGRSGPESGPTEVTVTPSNRHRMFSTLVQEAARCGEQLGVTFSSGDKYYQRSDHYNFAKKGIPVVFFCNGEHEDYHQVSDHADKLDGQKMERIARLAFWTGWQTANADERPRQLGRRETWLGDAPKVPAEAGK